jgi:uncharacterized membrane protein YkvA (DUF1232 family)
MGSSPPLFGRRRAQMAAGLAAGYNGTVDQINVTKKLGSLMSLLGMHHTARLFISMWFDRRMPWWLKVSAISGMVYIFSPLDVIPDISGVGLLDDIIVALLIMQAFVEYAPQDVLEYHCERLKIRPEQAQVDVPRTVRDALELYEWVTSKSWGPQQRREVPQEQAPTAEPQEPPQYIKYSAFQGEKERA